MLAFTRKPPPDNEVPGRAELLLDDAEDSLVPLTPAPAGDPAPPVSPEHDVLRTASVAGGAARNALTAFVTAEQPQFGWRRVVFVVTGIGLAPSRTELALRAQIALLLECVGSSSLDPEKEASS